MPRSFSEQEKENIRNKLVEACAERWTRFGYKKTSVDELCQRACISKGAFYLFFDSKESLFCEVICSVQRRIHDTASSLIRERPGKAGVTDALRYIYREYERNGFVYDSSSADLTALTNKLTPAQAARLRQAEDQNRLLFLEVPRLRRKLPEELTASIIYSLLMGVKQRDVLPNHMEVFDYLAEHIVEDIYE